MKTIIFGGTTEGREQAALALARGESVLVSVTSEYARQFLPEGAACHIGALDEAAMKAWIAAERPERVIDATHPFAVRATQTIRACADALHIPYVRIERAADRREDWRDAVTWAGNSEEAAALAALCAGNILLTTGSHTLSVYAKVIEPERLFVRVLPTHQALDLCAAAGMVQSHVIAMQGPFSAGMNAALIRQTGAEILVTKDTGATGGFAEKLAAARETGIKTLIIARPREESGRSLAEMQAFLREELGLAEEKKQTAPPRFPLFVPLEGRRCAVFGAGKIAARRAAVLRRFGACVTVTAPEKRAEIEINLCRGYEKSDLSGAFLAVAATDDRAVNHRIAEDCASLGIPVSVADSALESTFFFPAVCEGTELTAGVVSRGTSHAKTAEAARRIRRVLEEMT